MPWTEQAPGRWRRPLGDNERLIKWIGDQVLPTSREHWSVTIVGSFVISGHAEKTRQSKGAAATARLACRAWILLRLRHPSIAAACSADGDFLEYVVCHDSAALGAWADETFSIVDESQHASASHLIPTIRPSAYSTGFLLPHAGQVVLHLSHWRTDGYGALHLLNDFFAALADAFAASAPDEPLPALGDEPARLTVSMEEALELPEQLTHEILAATAEAMATVSLVQGSVGLPLRKTPSSPVPPSPGGTRFLHRALSPEATTEILAGCAEGGVGWLAAVHTSLAAVNFAAASASEDQGHHHHYTSAMRFGLRPYLPGRLAGSASAAALYTGAFFAKVNYDGLYSKGPSRGFLDARRQYATVALQAIQRAAAGGAAAPTRSEVDISSVGDADDIVQATHHPVVHDDGERRGGAAGGVQAEVTDLFLGVECLQPESYLFVCLFRDRLQFSLAYNEAYFDEPFMVHFLARVGEVLQTELGVGSA